MVLIYLEEMHGIVRPLNEGTIRSIPLDFILNMIGIAVALSYLRSRFDDYHYQINENNIKIHQVNNQLKDQNRVLKSQGDRIEKINSNLMQIVEERTRQLEFQKEKVKQQALQNADTLRAPIVEILELLTVLETDDTNPSIQKLRHETLRIDQTIEKINDLMGE